MIVDKTVKVSQAADMLGTGLVKFVADTKKALADGWQPGQDVPVVLMALYADIVSHISDIGKLGPEAMEDKYAFQRAWLLAGVEMEKSLLG